MPSDQKRMQGNHKVTCLSQPTGWSMAPMLHNIAIEGHTPHDPWSGIPLIFSAEGQPFFIRGKIFLISTSLQEKVYSRWSN